MTSSAPNGTLGIIRMLLQGGQRDKNVALAILQCWIDRLDLPPLYPDMQLRGKYMHFLIDGEWK